METRIVNNGKYFKVDSECVRWNPPHRLSFFIDTDDFEGKSFRAYRKEYGSSDITEIFIRGFSSERAEIRSLKEDALYMEEEISGHLDIQIRLEADLNRLKEASIWTRLKWVFTGVK